MSRFPLAVSAMTLLLIAAPTLRAEDSAPKAKAKDNKFKMGEVTVVVTGNLDPVETANTMIEAEQLQQLNRDEISAALSTLPGISLVAGGARNETMFYLRGNDPRRVPVFVDGVPCSIPYDGNIDYSRFTTFDLAEIQVAKGFSSIAFGANTLGGAVNVVTRKPVKAFEGDVRLGAFDGQGRTEALNIGSNQGWWYLQGSASKSQADYFRMSSNYTPGTVTTSTGLIVTEDGGHRGNSYFDDKKLSMKVGLTPNATDEYVLGFVRQRGDKGDPVVTTRTTTASSDKSVHYWQWPLWNMDSTFLVTNTAIGANSYVKSRTYFNRYENGIDLYTDGTYSTLYQKVNGSYNASGFNAGAPFSDTGKTRYKDFSQGLMLEFGTVAFTSHSLRAILQTKTDVHREGGDSTVTGDTATWRHFQYRFLTAGLEDSITLAPTLDLSLGAGWDRNEPVVAYGFTALPPTRSYFHGQAGAFWKVAPDTKLYATIAQKDRFATLKELYSKYQGNYTPNPNLKPETSLNYEVGVRSTPTGWLELEAALFKSDIKDMIQGTGSGSTAMNVNIGKVVNQGVEISAGIKPNKHLKGGLGYTYLDRQNKSDSTVLTNTPKHRVTGYLRVDPVETFYAQASLQAQDMLWDSTASGTTPATRVGGFSTTDIALGWQPTVALSFEGGFKNAFDRNYQYSTGYPMQGRTWFANARYNF